MGPRLSNLLLYASTFVALIVVGQFLDDFKTAFVVLSVGVFAIAINEMKANISERWFQAAVLFLAAIHALVAVFVDVKVPTGPAIAYVGPFVFADGFAILGLLVWLRSHFARR
jgi:hypothetical protein